MYNIRHVNIFSNGLAKTDIYPAIFPRILQSFYDAVLDTCRHECQLIIQVNMCAHAIMCVKFNFDKWTFLNFIYSVLFYLFIGIIMV
jgi:hypothetical protein